MLGTQLPLQRLPAAGDSGETRPQKGLTLGPQGPQATTLPGLFPTGSLRVCGHIDLAPGAIVSRSNTP
jgi:hypothetical protein